MLLSVSELQDSHLQTRDIDSQQQQTWGATNSAASGPHVFQARIQWLMLPNTHLPSFSEELLIMNKQGTPLWPLNHQRKAVRKSLLEKNISSLIKQKKHTR